MLSVYYTFHIYEQSDTVILFNTILEMVICPIIPSQLQGEDPTLYSSPPCIAICKTFFSTDL